MYAKLFRNTITNGKSQTVPLRFFFEGRGGGGGGLCTGYLCLCPLGLAAKLNFLIYRKWSIAPIEFYIALGLLFCLYEAIKLSKCEVKHK